MAATTDVGAGQPALPDPWIEGDIRLADAIGALLTRRQDGDPPLPVVAVFEGPETDDFVDRIASRLGSHRTARVPARCRVRCCPRMGPR